MSTFKIDNGLAELAVNLMDAVASGLIACRRDGRVLHANRAAVIATGLTGPLRLEDGVLVCGAADRGLLDAAMADATRGIRRLLSIGRDEHALMVVTQPLERERPHETAVLLTLGRRSLCTPLGLEMLARRHGLTLTETRVLNGLIDSHGARRIAEDHGVQLSTVRTQIQSIRDKIGVRSIDELLLRVAQVPAVAARA